MAVNGNEIHRLTRRRRRTSREKADVHSRLRNSLHAACLHVIKTHLDLLKCIVDNFAGHVALRF